MVEPAVLSWLIGLAVLALWLGIIRLRRPSRLAKLRHAALARLSWSELAQLLQRAKVRSGAMSDQSVERRNEGSSYDFIFQRDGQRELLACRHGDRRVITEQMLDELAAARVPAAARHAIFATTGRVSRRVAEHAQQLGIELLHGRALWDFLAPVIPAELQRHGEQLIQREFMAQALTAAAIAIGGGVALNFTLRSANPPPAAPPAPAPASTPVAEPAAEPVPATQTSSSSATIEPSEDLAAQIRRDALQALRQLPEVANAAWPSHSTALVVLKPGSGGLTEEIARRSCEALAKHAVIGDVRIQFANAGKQPNDQSVRWRQCRPGESATPAPGGMR